MSHQLKQCVFPTSIHGPVRQKTLSWNHTNETEKKLNPSDLSLQWGQVKCEVSYVIGPLIGQRVRKVANKLLYIWQFTVKAVHSRRNKWLKIWQVMKLQFLLTAMSSSLFCFGRHLLNKWHRQTIWKNKCASFCFVFNVRRWVEQEIYIYGIGLLPFNQSCHIPITFAGCSIWFSAIIKHKGMEVFASQNVYVEEHIKSWFSDTDFQTIYGSLWILTSLLSCFDTCTDM